MRFSFWDVGLALTIGVLAYFMERAKFPVSPILLALILGPMAEQNMRRALMLSHDDPSIFLTRPLSAAFLILAVFMAVTSYKKFKKLREIERDLTKSGS